MYAGENGSKTGYWWLASPSSYASDRVCRVYGCDAYLGYNYCGYACGVGPLVSLKSGIPVQVEEQNTQTFVNCQKSIDFFQKI